MHACFASSSNRILSVIDGAHFVKQLTEKINADFSLQTYEGTAASKALGTSSQPWEIESFPLEEGFDP